MVDEVRSGVCRILRSERDRLWCRRWRGDFKRIVLFHQFAFVNFVQKIWNDWNCKVHSVRVHHLFEEYLPRWNLANVIRCYLQLDRQRDLGPHRLIRSSV